MIQTGGNINFVLQVRDVQDWKYNDKTFDSWKAIDYTAQKQANMIKKFVKAHDALNAAKQGVEMPGFYIGAVEKRPETLLDDKWGYKGIYNQVEEMVGSELITGAYYGEDVNYNAEEHSVHPLVTSVASFVHEEKGKQLLWIPYFGADLKNIQTQEGKEEAMKMEVANFWNDTSTVATITHATEWPDFPERPLFDTIILQPGTYYGENKLGEYEVKYLAERVKSWDNNGGHYASIGIELEYDMGMLTGRDDPGYSLRNTQKKERFLAYLTYVVPLMGTNVPVGIYSGGPNEQGYGNIWANHNPHNTGNHRVQDSWLGEGYNYESPESYIAGNGVPYSGFPAKYNGNLIYDINNYVFGRGMSETLQEFLYGAQ